MNLASGPSTLFPTMGGLRSQRKRLDLPYLSLRKLGGKCSPKKSRTIGLLGALIRSGAPFWAGAPFWSPHFPRPAPFSARKPENGAFKGLLRPHPLLDVPQAGHRRPHRLRPKEEKKTKRVRGTGLAREPEGTNRSNEPRGSVWCIFLLHGKKRIPFKGRPVSSLF